MGTLLLTCSRAHAASPVLQQRGAAAGLSLRPSGETLGALQCLINTFYFLGREMALPRTVTFHF